MNNLSYSLFRNTNARRQDHVSYDLSSTRLKPVMRQKDWHDSNVDVLQMIVRAYLQCQNFKNGSHLTPVVEKFRDVLDLM